jgi:tungstate transport system substrate-binding protein
MPRRALLLASAALLCVLLLPAVAAHADSASALTVVGTSDVSDSGLMPNLIQPEFSAAYPQFTFKYIGTATGTAITDAQTGSVGASVLIVHAASLENQFVANGYSYEQYGRALFTNDFVLAGPSSDPAGVGAPGAHNIVQAFADVAAKGASSTPAPITFVSRGGTPGTTVEEHQIWALVASSGLQPAGLTLCTLNGTVGGGETPVTSTTVMNSGDPCPTGGALPPAGDLPPWYVTTGATQGPNVVDANNCSFTSGANTCYVLTDRGTFDFLASGTDPAGSIPNLTILTRGPQAASAPGGTYLLTNYFHGYIINPNQAVQGGTTLEPVNLTAAQDFLNFITSPAVQAQLKTYLSSTTDSAGPPFVADASPNITAAGFPATITGGTPITVAGSVTNAEPGFPVLSGKTVSVDEIVGGVGVPVATGTTDLHGSYSISFVPPASGSYEVSTNTIAQIENASLSPVFGDLLSPASTAPVAVNVQGTVSISSATPSAGGVTVAGKLQPPAPDTHATVTILAHKGTGRFGSITTTALTNGASAYATFAKLTPGSWQVEAAYQDPGQLLQAVSNVVTVVVPPAKVTHALKFKRISSKKGKVTVTGTLKPAPSTSGAKIELLALRTVSKKKSVHLRQVAKTSLGKGKTTFTIRTTLKRHARWLLQLEYVQEGQTTTFSRVRTVTVR